MKLHRVHQRLTSSPLADVAAEVRKQLERLGSSQAIPQGPVAITGGSRGIANIALILRTAGEWLREQGAQPFLAPCMGSHNGATAEGQTAMLAAIGMTEQTVEMPIRSSMDVVDVNSKQADQPVWMDRHCYEAAGVLVINRVKLHTSFGGPPYGKHCESGLVKMMTVGMGKLQGAQAFHATSTADKPNAMVTMAESLIKSEKIWGGLAILEDGYDQTAELHAMAPQEIIQREPTLLAHYAETYYPRLPIDNLNALVVGTIGKNYSGTGMDTNVIGRRGLSDAPDPPTPKIKQIAALDLSEASHGNAVGVGLADVVTQRLRDKINLEKTQLNAITAGEPNKAKVPLVLPNDQAVLEWLQKQSGKTRWMLIPNTLHLGELYVSADLNEELAANPLTEIDSVGREIEFDNANLKIDWS